MVLSIIPNLVEYLLYIKIPPYKNAIYSHRLYNIVHNMPEIIIVSFLFTKITMGFFLSLYMYTYVLMALSCD